MGKKNNKRGNHIHGSKLPVCAPTYRDKGLSLPLHSSPNVATLGVRIQYNMEMFQFLSLGIQLDILPNDIHLLLG